MRPEYSIVESFYKRARSSYLGITDKILVSARVSMFDRDSEQTIGSILTNFCTQVFMHNILIEFVNGENRVNPCKITATLNI